MSSNIPQEKLVDAIREYNVSRQCSDKGSLCHAPESSLYFGRDGLVSACCYSRPAPLGRYPDQSIEEIWNGAQVNTMRASLRRNELPAGCELCADQIYAHNFSGLLARRYDGNARPLPPSGLLPQIKALLQPNKPRRYPQDLEFELSNNCNLECAMCSGFFSSSIRARREKLPPLPQVYDKTFVEQLVPFLPHLKRAKFLGGEPFLIDLYYKIWDHLIELNPDCTILITTNGTVYTDKVKRVLEKLNCQIIVSLDSITKDTYEAIRKNATLERTLSNLETFCAINRRKGKGLSIAICPMVSNCREIPGLVSFANERGISVFFNTVVFPADHSIKVLSREVQSELLDLYRNANPSPRNEIEAANQAALQSFCGQIEFWMEEAGYWSLVRQYCAQWLSSGKESGAVAALLADLAGKDAASGEALIQINASDPLKEVKEYYRAIWEVGSRLKSVGLLSNMNFNPDDLRVFLGYLDSNVRPSQARQMITGLRQFSRETLQSCGTLTAPKLIEQLESYYATGVH